MSKIIIVPAVAIVALIAIGIASITSDHDNETVVSGKLSQPSLSKGHDQDTTRKITPHAAEMAQQKKATKTSNKKPKQKSTSKKQPIHKSVRVSWPGMKYRTVRVVHEGKIEPVTELRTWTRKQWIAKVKSLRQADKDELAGRYITAYNRQYPGKDLNNYLK